MGDSSAVFTVSESFAPQSNDGNVVFGYGTTGSDVNAQACLSKTGWSIDNLIVNRSLCADAMTAELMARKA